MLRGQGHDWAGYFGDTWGDYTFKLRVKLIKGGIHLNYRLSQCLRYFIGFSEQGLYLSKTSPCGTHRQLRAVSQPHSLRRWYEVKITGSGGKIDVYVDGSLKLSFTDPDPLFYGAIALETLENSEAYVDDIVVLGAASPALGLGWIRTGGPLGGLGYDIRMRPDNPDIMYVTDAWSGVHISTDGGRTWRASNEGITTRGGPSGDAIPVFSLTTDPGNPDVIWCGTQNRRGIYKSADGGKTWIEKDKGIVEDQGISFRGFAVDPHNSNTVYAAAEISSYAWTPDRQRRSGRTYDLTKGAVYKTTNGGEYWARVWQGDNLARYIWIDPRNCDVLYVSTGIFDREAANSDARTNSPGGVGILKSTDGGHTWRALNETNGLQNLYVGSLFMHPRNPDILLAGAGSNVYSQGAGVYLTVDGGQSWQRVLAPQGPLPGIAAVEYSMSNPKIAYAGNQSGVYRSDDGGHSWRVVTGGAEGLGVSVGGFFTWGSPGVFAGEPIDFQVDSRDPDRIFANNYGGGNFLSCDGGEIWTNASQGYTGAQVNAVVTSSVEPGGVYAAARCNLFASTDYGTTWNGLSHEPAISAEWYAILALPGSAGLTLLASEELSGVIFRSTDSGASWTVAFRAENLLGQPIYRNGFKTIVAAPSSPRVIYAGMCLDRVTLEQGVRRASFGVFWSGNGGLTWHDANDEQTADQNVNVLAVDPDDWQTVYAGTVEDGVFKTTDSGATWQALNQGLRVLDVRALSIDPTNSRVLYAGTEGGGVYKSINGGTSWRSSSSGMNPEAVVRAIVVDPSNPQVLYAADFRAGVFRSQDSAGSWVKVNEGLRTRAVRSLAITSDGKVLYAATEGEGVFRLDLPQETAWGSG